MPHRRKNTFALKYVRNRFVCRQRDEDFIPVGKINQFVRFMRNVSTSSLVCSTLGVDTLEDCDSFPSAARAR